MEYNPQSNAYIIRGGQTGLKRLAILHQALRPTTQDFFARSGLTTGLEGVDLGCGGGAVTLDLGEFVGQTGCVIGIDKDAEKIAFARLEAKKRGLEQVYYQQADILDSSVLPQGQDFVYARFLLTHLPDPASTIVAMYNMLKPGGCILLEDIDFAGHFCYPACAAFDAYVALYSNAVRRQGADPNIGPRLPALVQAAGFHGLNLKVVQPVFQRGEAKQMASLTLENIADTLVREQLALPETIAAHLNELRAFEQEEGSLLSLPRIFQVWAVK